MKRAMLALALAAAPIAPAGARDAAPAYPNGIDGAELAMIVNRAVRAQGGSGKPQIAANRRFPPCDHVPEAGPANGNWSLVRLSCDAPRNWIRHIRTDGGGGRYRPAATTQSEAAGAEVVTLSRSLKRGAVITRADIELAPAGASSGLGVFTDPSDVIGRKLVANVGEGRILQARQLEQNWLIGRDMRVEIAFQTAAVTVSMPGIALQNGQLGELIEVRNTSSGRILQATVTGPQKVKINAKTQ